MTTVASNCQSSSTVASQLAGFRGLCEARSGRALAEPVAMHSFSIQEPELFWRALLDWSELPWTGSADPVLVGHDVETARFFPHLALNYADALLRPISGHDDDAPAITSVHSGAETEVFSRRGLREAVSATAAALAASGVEASTRVVAVAPNNARMTIAVLAAAALGATVATATPDVGTPGLLSRFGQVEPALLLLDRAEMPGDPGPAIDALISGLPTLRNVMFLDELPLPDRTVPPVARLSSAVATAADAARPERPQLPFDHPLFVMFSSGTTGPPKAMVHGAGGTLLEHVKEHRLHGDLRAGETLYFHTTTAWMMWNWQLSALAVGAHIVLYDGPIQGPATLWELVAAHGVDVFGTSPAYLQLCQDSGYRPAEAMDIANLRAIMSTGAVLHEWQFDWVAEAVGPQPLQSISGGTDIIGCFVLGHPELPVIPGRCQSRSLGLDVVAVDEEGGEIVDAVGELVCRGPFPSRPVGFLRDPGNERFHRAYFADHDGVWTHGDLIEFDATGSARMHGRSDGVLNIDGIRIGPSEIYTTLRQVPGIVDAMAVEQRDNAHPGATRMVLLVVLDAGRTFDSELDRTIRRTLRRENSAAHVPALVVAIAEVPTTHNGKRSERAARDAVNGDPVANSTALKNPACLADIRAAVLAASRSDVGTAGTGSDPVMHEADDVELVRRIWQDVLGMSGAEPGDDFNDMGGTSRGVVDLLRRVKLGLGADIAIQAFLADSTLQGLAAAVTAARAAVADSVPLLRAGVGRPIFLLADHCGQLNLFHGLVEAMDTERPIRGLVPPVVDAEGRRRRVADIAADAIDLLRSAQGEAAPSLIGFSFGGLVAYEMACRLRAEGKLVEFVGLIDVVPPAASLTPPETVARRWANRLRMLTTLQAARDALDWQRRLRSETVDPEWDEFRKACETFDAHRLARFDGTLTYYLAAERTPLVGNQLAVWRRVAPHMVLTEVSGSHWTMLGGRHGVRLASRISATVR